MRMSLCKGFIRHFYVGQTSLARFSKVGSNVKTNIKKPTRQEKIDKANMFHQSKLYHIHNEFNLFNPAVTKVLDLGYVPGNWLSFAKFKLCEAHKLPESKLSEKCHLLGFDILFSTPPTGTSTIQGNVFSQSSHKLITNHFMNFAKSKAYDTSPQPSYFENEKVDSLITDEIDELTDQLSSVTLVNAEKLDYKPEVILSDLSAPFMQEKGFFNNTNTRPYLRFGNNEGLSQPIINKAKSAIDMADATLILSCDLLKKGGTLVIRMAQFDESDPELQLVRNRLDKVFHKVTDWSTEESRDFFFVCQDKKHDWIDKREVFSR